MIQLPRPNGSTASPEPKHAPGQVLGEGLVLLEGDREGAAVPGMHLRPDRGAQEDQADDGVLPAPGVATRSRS